MDDRTIFLRVAVEGSFTAAARYLNLTTPAVSKRVRQLEERLGIRLLHRTTRKISLTEAGRQYVQNVAPLVDALTEAEEHIAGFAKLPRGHLRISAPLSFGSRQLGAVCAEFCSRYPLITTEFFLDDRFVNLIDGGFDVALRIGQLLDSTLVARPLGSFRLLLCASPGYLEKFGAPAKPRELQEHQCLHYMLSGSPRSWKFSRDEQKIEVTIKGPVCADNGDFLSNAAISGLGIVLMPEFIVADALHSGQLVKLLPQYDCGEVELNAVYPSRAYLPAVVRLFLDHLSEHFSQTGLSISK